MHAMEGTSGSGRNVESAEQMPRENRESPGASPQIPQNQQNGAALPEETAASSLIALSSSAPSLSTASSSTTSSSMKVDNVEVTIIKKETKNEKDTNSLLLAGTSQLPTHSVEPGPSVKKKRKSNSEETSTNGHCPSKKQYKEQTQMQEQEQSTLSYHEVAEQYAAKACELEAEIKRLDELADSAEKRWNNIIREKKKKEAEYIIIKKKTQFMRFMDSGSDLSIDSLSLNQWKICGDDITSKERSSEDPCKYLSQKFAQHTSTTCDEKSLNVVVQRQEITAGTSSGNRQQDAIYNLENRQVAEGRQGARVSVQTILDKHRSANPEVVPRRGRRMRNSVNLGLTAGGAMVETAGHNVDSRPSSTDSSKSNPNAADVNIKEVLMKFTKISQQGELIKIPQNYPDVTLHPVPPVSQNTSSPQQSSSLLHGILTKTNSPRPTTFSPTLAKLLTAPERERNSSTSASTVSLSQQGSTTQSHLQPYQGSNLGISELLSSSKGSEITITPVKNVPAPQSHSNDVIHVEDLEEETPMIDGREGNYSSTVRNGREERDNVPQCQGCNKRAAQFVCAGCTNQWYCSRECQVDAWDEHSEICTG